MTRSRPYPDPPERVRLTPADWWRIVACAGAVAGSVLGGSATVVRHLVALEHRLTAIEACQGAKDLADRTQDQRLDMHDRRLMQLGPGAGG